MTKHVSTKRALIASLLSLVLCVSMLVGSTFAWFTDTATTGVNTIQAGNLDVALEMFDGTDWVSAEGKTLQFLVEGKIPAEGTKILWEPGCTYALPPLRVVNAGNLALKYEVVITGLNGDAKLNQAIDWTITGTEDGHLLAKESKEFSISGHMKEDAGNEYQGLTIDGISITVYATQYTYEKDSKDETYDTDAKFLYTDAEGNLLIGSADELVYFAKTVNVDKTDYNGKTVKLTADIDLGGRSWAPLMVNAEMTFDGNGKTISNFVVSGEKNVGFFGTATKCTIQNLTVRNATVTGINHVAAIAGDALCATIDGCKVYDSTITTEVKNNDDGDKAGAIAGYLSAEPNASVTNCTVESCTVKGYRDIGGLVGYVNAPKPNSIATVTGNSVSKVTLVNDQSVNYKNYSDSADFDVNDIVGEINRVGTVNDSSNTATDVTRKLDSIGDNANITISDTVNIDSSTKIGAGTTISGTGTDSTLNVVKASISADDVTLKDMTINGSGSVGTSGTLNISGSNTVIENIDYQGGGNIAITVSTNANNSGTIFKGTRIVNAFRGIQFWSLSGDSVIDNCILDVAGYTFNIDSAVAGATLTVKNSTLNGWTSYTSGIKLVRFEKCKFGANVYEYLRPYSETIITDCEFTSDGYQLNAGGSGAYTIKIDNCTKQGTEITAENIQSLLLDMDDWNKNVTLIVNGTVVSLN